MGELLDYVEHAILPSIVGAILNKVVRPDMIAVLGPQPDARSVRQPEPAAFGLLIGDLQPLLSPDPLDALVVDEPARLLQQHRLGLVTRALECDPAEEVLAEIRRQAVEVGDDLGLVL